MNSQWEKYVEQVAAVLAPHVQVWRIWDHDERAVCLGCDWTSETEGHELSAAWAAHMAALALPVVGPLIAEDTRARMVAAAGRAVERECAVDSLAAVRELHSAKQVPRPSHFTTWCDECQCSWPCHTAAILEGMVP